MKKNTALIAGGITLAGTLLFGGVFAATGSFTVPVLLGLLLGFAAALLCLFLFYKSANAAPGNKNASMMLFFLRWGVAFAVVAVSVFVPAIDSVAAILPLALPVLAAAILMAAGK